MCHKKMSLQIQQNPMMSHLNVLPLPLGGTYALVVEHVLHKTES